MAWASVLIPVPISRMDFGLVFWSRANSQINEFLENEKAVVCSSKSLYLKNGCFSDTRVNLALLTLSNKCRNNREGCLPPRTHGSITAFQLYFCAYRLDRRFLYLEAVSHEEYFNTSTFAWSRMRTVLSIF